MGLLIDPAGDESGAAEERNLQVRSMKALESVAGELAAVVRLLKELVEDDPAELRRETMQDEYDRREVEALERLAQAAEDRNRILSEFGRGGHNVLSITGRY